MHPAAPAFVLLVSALAAAGCFGGQDEAGPSESETATPTPTISSTSTTAEPATPAYATAAIRHLGVPAYEPTMAIDSQGGLYYVAAIPGYTVPPLYLTGVPGSMWVMRSTDAGATWQNLTESFVAGPSIDPFLTIDPITQRLYRAAYQPNSLGGHGCIDLLWSDDRGDSWTTNPIACGLPPPLHDHESLASGVPVDGLPMMGYPNVLYLCANRAHGSECASSRDGGTLFGPFVNVYPSVGPDGYCGGLHSRVVTDAGGRVYLPRAYCQVPSIAVSEDGGLTWARHAISTEHLTPPSTLAEVGEVGVPYIDLQDVQVAVDLAGTLHAVWVAADRMPYVASSQDHGVTWSEAVSVAAPGLTYASGLVAVGAGGPGQAAFAYVATRHAAGLAEDPFTADWAGAKWHLFLVLADGSGELRVLQANADDDSIGTGDCGLNRCTPCPDEACPGMYDYIDVDIDPTGRPWVAFVDVCHSGCLTSGAHDRAEAAVATLSEGPALVLAGGRLQPLQWA